MPEINIDDLELERECAQCQGSHGGCWRCMRGMELTEAGEKTLRLVEKHLTPDARGGWELR